MLFFNRLIMISIVIPLYNKELYIENTLNIILNQTYQNFEVIIVDDGSTDNGSEIVESFTDERIKLFKKENGGVSSARNFGVDKSNYEYVAFLDADDEWLKNHLEEINRLIMDYGDEADVFVTNFSRKYANGKVLVNRLDINRGVIEDYFSKVLSKDVIHTSCVCIKKSSLLEVGGFNNLLSRGEDLDVWIRLNRKYKTAYTPEITEIYLQDAVNNSKKNFPIEKSLLYHIDKDDIKYRSERKYIKKLIIRKIISLLINEKRFFDAWTLLWSKKNMLI